MKNLPRWILFYIAFIVYIAPGRGIWMFLVQWVLDKSFPIVNFWGVVLLFLMWTVVVGVSSIYFFALLFQILRISPSPNKAAKQLLIVWGILAVTGYIGIIVLRLSYPYLGLNILCDVILFGTLSVFAFSWDEARGDWG